MGRHTKRQASPPPNLVVQRLRVGREDMLVFEWGDSAKQVEGLTEAERDVLARVVRGDSNAAIAKARKSSVRTVANQVASLLRKTSAKSRYDLIRRYG